MLIDSAIIIVVFKKDVGDVRACIDAFLGGLLSLLWAQLLADAPHEARVRKVWAAFILLADWNSSNSWWIRIAGR